ncbi:MULTISPECIES: flavodoxin family protein [unclassified Candidatus Frackibacter]|uniref:flavodoxin family protein n=1 Tax=unclassified Candidatus Frackibacter TaxID=2648818 RepID=UPI00087F9683|nr:MULTISPECIES: flavodoxin family protein [unclassified Candidatus Frackibacter]SDB97450.1 Multimeric flavodoxin WrbA [Candidatus Frackibacter sp. WG11]SEM29132.1 Multimeric flavodoxin WrbA [Candidatus Frackibacter sp. WG12]SFL33995.1 Multimeric flavodoxin WrbA [Candidatus Frackibacter sp. WG13]
MKIIGFSAGAIGRKTNVDRMVKTIMDESGFEAEFVKLTDLNYSGCKGCANLCAEPQECRLKDDLYPYYKKIKEADAVVVGSPIYFGSINAMTISFLERFFGYRHVNNTIAGKPFVLAVSGGGFLEKIEEQFNRLLDPFDVEILEFVKYESGIMPCFKCGRHQECKIGGAYHKYGEEVFDMDITQDMFNAWEDNPQILSQVENAVKKLKDI